jgi:hypothetical protein
VATKIAQEGQSIRKTAKSISSLHHSSNPCFKATELRQVIGELMGAAYFWEMYSCKYSKVSKRRQSQTKQLNLQNIAFI